jgi:PAS domain S-box-containing protein
LQRRPRRATTKIIEATRLIIVDDQAGTVALLTELCRTLGWRAHAAASVTEAILMVRELGGFELAIVEHSLPDGSGVDLARQLRRRSPDSEIVVCAADPSLAAANEAFDAGAYDFVRKPIEDVEMFKLRLKAARDKVLLSRRFRQSEERYKSAFFAAFDALLVVHEGRILEVNPSAAQLFGVSEDELRGEPIAQVVQETQNAFEGEETIRVAGGEKRVEIVRSGIMLGGGAAMLYTLRDVTARAEAEKERERLERTLRESRTMEALGRLAGGVAHDFNNLLSVILASAELLQTSSDTDVQRGVGDILTAGRSAADLVQRILAFGRGAQRRAGRCDVTAAIKELDPLLRSSLGTRAALTIAAPSRALGAGVDSDEIGQILMNLVINARDAVNKGGQIGVAIEHRELDETAAKQEGLSAAAYVVLSVQDDGCGMPAHVLERIFEPYFTTKAQGKGTGLGLATVYGIVKNRGGAIRVRSEVDHGTMFTVFLPAV